MLKPITTVGLALAFSVAALQAQSPDSQLKLRYQSFDPLEVSVEVPQTLRGTADSNLWIVQTVGTPTNEHRAALSAAGAQLHGYLPHNAYVMRASQADALAMQGIEGVRFVGPYHAAFRLEPELIAEHAAGEMETRRYNIVVVDKRNDKPALIRAIRAMGGVIDHEQDGSLLLEATLTSDQLLKTAHLDQVLWIDRWTTSEEDVDNARIQGGANYVETQGGWTGTGVNAHIYEGIEATHPDFSGAVLNVRSGGAAQSHGHATAGIVFGNGTSNPAVRGLAPDAGKFYTNYTSVVGSRYQVVDDLVNIHGVSHTTASWGGGRTFFYTSVSAETDDIIFDHNISWTQSQSNAGNQDSRPQAWAKNVFSVGGVRHGDNSNPADDTWSNSGSTGPASDGRIKPTLSAYYDSIGTSDLTGSAGYSSGNWTSGFGGTSGATPIVAGHNVIAIEMFTDAIFGNTLRNPGGTRHSNRPHFTTLKALQVASATQYAFTAGSTDNRREHVGWGFPSLRKMYDNRANMFVLDETDILAPGDGTRHTIQVNAGNPDLKICMSYADPAGNPAASMHRINNLSLRVTAPNGTEYWGNNGLEQGIWSVSGGAEDLLNTVECVFIQNPAAGAWRVDVLGREIVADSHVETAGVDADYGLVVSGGVLTGSGPLVVGSFSTFGAGCASSQQVPGSCGQLNAAGGTLTNSTNGNEYAYRVAGTGSNQLSGFDIWTASVSGSVSATASVYADAGGLPGTTLGTATVTIGATPGFYGVTFSPPLAVNGTFYVAINHAGASYISNLTSGSAGTGYFRTGANAWNQSGLVTTPSYRTSCAPAFVTPTLTGTGSPLLGGSYTVELSNAPSSSVVALFTGFSTTTWSGGALPAMFPGAVGCNLLVSPDSSLFFVSTPAGTSSLTFPIPNDVNFLGIMLHHQWYVSDPTNNPLGVASSNGGTASIGS